MVPRPREKLDRSYRARFSPLEDKEREGKEADAARKLNRESPTSFGGVRLRSGGGQGGKEGGKAGWDGETEERSSWEEWEGGRETRK